VQVRLLGKCFVSVLAGLDDTSGKFQDEWMGPIRNKFKPDEWDSVVGSESLLSLIVDMVSFEEHEELTADNVCVALNRIIEQDFSA